MKILNDFLNRIGTDKALHFTVGFIIDSMLLPFGKEYTIIGVMAVLILACIKETIDSYEKGNKCDWIDIGVSVFGALASCVYFHIVM